jgi:hypothetical protein
VTNKNRTLVDVTFYEVIAFTMGVAITTLAALAIVQKSWIIAAAIPVGLAIAPLSLCLGNWLGKKLCPATK